MRFWRRWRQAEAADAGEDRLRRQYATFQKLLALNDECLELLAAMQEDLHYVPALQNVIGTRVDLVFQKAREIVGALEELTGKRYPKLVAAIEGQRHEVDRFLLPPERMPAPHLAAWLEEVTAEWTPLVGGKAAMLAAVRNELGVRVPDGYVVTTSAYRQHFGIPRWRAIRDELRNLDIHDPEALARASARLTQMVMEQPLPRALEVAVSERALSLGRQGGALAIRSSALGEEGGEKTYAGQYLSLLNVPAGKAVEAYRRVVAARFSERALYYRLATGLLEVDTPMAVLFVLMVRARTSGVMYTRDPSDPKKKHLWITATPGLGAELASGRTPGDLYVMTRRWSGGALVSHRLARKEGLLEPAEEEGLIQVPIESPQAMESSLHAEELQRLFDIGVKVEDYFRKPQDIEWVIDHRGDIWIVQTRALALGGQQRSTAAVKIEAEPLLRGGQVVYPGRVSGAAFLAEGEAEVKRAPAGAVLFVRKPSPEMVEVFERIGGLVAEYGNLAGHVGALLREFKVPSVFLLGGAFERLKGGEAVSLDAVRGTVYAGSYFPARVVEPAIPERFQQSGPGDVINRRVLALALLDPGAINFRPGGCKSVHDVLRFCHETAVRTMFTANDVEAAVSGKSVRRLKSHLPMDLYVLDLGGGVRMERDDPNWVTPEEVVSRPFVSIWKGFNHPEVSWTRTMPATLSDMASVLGRTLAPQGAETRTMSDRSYLLVADEYVNMNSRLAFHFALVDACLTDVATQNYISFRFAGGGATRSRRSLRACFIEACLRHYGFRVERRGDLVNAWLKKMPAEVTDASLDILGRLMASTCQLDMYMTSEAAMRWYVQEFLAGNYSFRPQGEGGR